MSYWLYDGFDVRYGIPMGKQFDDFDSLLGESKDHLHTHSNLLSKGNIANVTSLSLSRSLCLCLCLSVSVSASLSLSLSLSPSLSIKYQRVYIFGYTKVQAPALFQHVERGR